VTKVVTFGAFVEILPGVEGLVHISELAQHHVENPREVVSQGDLVNVKIIEVDAERRRLSLSLKRIEDGEQTQPLPEGAEPLRPAIDLSEEVFAEAPDAVVEADEILTKDDVEEPAAEEPAAEAEPEAEEPAAEAEPEAEEPAAEAEPEAEDETAVEPDADGQPPA
jgi:small subunit ribosomal protein S1